MDVTVVAVVLSTKDKQLLLEVDERSALACFRQRCECRSAAARAFTRSIGARATCSGCVAAGLGTNVYLDLELARERERRSVLVAS